MSKFNTPSYELDDIFDINCKKYNSYKKVQEECKKQVEELISKYPNIIFTGFQKPDELFFVPDRVILLVRYDYYSYYKYMINLSRYLGNNYLNYFLLNMRTLNEFTNFVILSYKLIIQDYPDAIILDISKAEKYINNIKMAPDSYLE